MFALSIAILSFCVSGAVQRDVRFQMQHPFSPGTSVHMSSFAYDDASGRQLMRSEITVSPRYGITGATVSLSPETTGLASGDLWVDLNRRPWLPNSNSYSFFARGHAGLDFGHLSLGVSSSLGRNTASGDFYAYSGLRGLVGVSYEGYKLSVDVPVLGTRDARFGYYGISDVKVELAHDTFEPIALLTTLLPSGIRQTELTLHRTTISGSEGRRKWTLEGKAGLSGLVPNLVDFDLHYRAEEFAYDLSLSAARGPDHNSWESSLWFRLTSDVTLLERDGTLGELGLTAYSLLEDGWRKTDSDCALGVTSQIGIKNNGKGFSLGFLVPFQGNVVHAFRSFGNMNPPNVSDCAGALVISAESPEEEGKAESSTGITLFLRELGSQERLLKRLDLERTISWGSEPRKYIRYSLVLESLRIDRLYVSFSLRDF